MSIVDIYTKSVRQNLSPLFANWDPGKPVELGDYGLLSDATFVHIGNIKDRGFNFDVRDDTTKDQKSFASSGSTEIKLQGKGATNINGVVNAKASLEINFSSENAVFFNAAECQFSMMRDKSAIGDEILKKFSDGSWKREWAVVTDLVQAGLTTIVISGGKSSSVVFEAQGNVDQINLADASAGLKLVTQKNVSYVVEAKQGLIPLIALSKIQQKHIWSGYEYQPCSFRCDAKMLSTMRNAPDIQTEEFPKDLYFGVIK